MPRKAFVADLKQAVSYCPVTGISDVGVGKEDGAFSFAFTSSFDGSIRFEIQALVPDVSEYPSDHQCYLYTASDGVPPQVSAALEALTEASRGQEIQQLLSSVSTRLSTALNPEASQHHPGSIGGPDDPPDESSSHADDGESDDNFEMDWPEDGPISTFTTPRISYGPDTPESGPADLASEELRLRLEKMRSDLRRVKAAGFKVGLIGDEAREGRRGFVSISCRISKLGISKEAMQAWAIQGHHYLIFLIHYTEGYRTAEQLITEYGKRARPSIEMHVRVSSRYKPTLKQALSVSSSRKPKDTRMGASGDGALAFASSSSPDDFYAMFLSRPLHALLNERLVVLLRWRFDFGFSWAMAEEYYDRYQGTNHSSVDLLQSLNKYDLEDHPKTKLSKLVAADHAADGLRPEDLSFPLVGMQFVLRHLVRCTEFCLVCHCKVNSTFEALKPYVCSKPLCLYQYMTLGLGPSIEYEIQNQPVVVDLLVSFCYASASARKLDHFPIGLNLMVPPPYGVVCLPDRAASLPASGSTAAGPDIVAQANDSSVVKFNVLVNTDLLQVVFRDPIDKPSPVSSGDWVVLYSPNGFSCIGHCQVENTAQYPTVDLSPLHRCGELTASERFSQAELIRYDRNFDLLTTPEKQSAIVSLLDVLPGVVEMKSFLAQRDSEDVSLASWSNRISPAALAILRWIITSNRSCILYQDLGRSTDEAVFGMKGWLQFRFVQGAPDKEQRFIDSLQKTTERLQLQYPSVFAWHGSPIGNWHMIVREGLHFKKLSHGRAYGNGCYHSLDYNVSTGYSRLSLGRGPFGRGPSSNTSSPRCWANSVLQIRNAICLNEIVNAPQEWTSSAPHLVVAQLDWIQTRYLFVESAIDSEPLPSRDVPRPVPEYKQDPVYTPTGSNQERIAIPMAVFGQIRKPFRPPPPPTQTKKRAAPAAAARGQKKKQKVMPTAPDHVSISSNEANSLYASDDTESDDDDDAKTEHTTLSDRDALISDGAMNDNDKSDIAMNDVVEGGCAKGKAIQPDIGKEQTTLTDFVPGTLDHATLPIMAPPAYATVTASKSLQRELRTVVTIQETQPAHELGWYVDNRTIANLYQWIVEMHSFDPALPIVTDMKKKNIKSIVLEMRFAKDYPMSPPFVRVIRPRFLTYHQRGGGHITAGGAVCMELLTNSGWSAACSIESVLLQVRMAMSSTEPFPARLDDRLSQDYKIGEAVDAYIRACRMHQWQVPEDFRKSHMET